MNASTKCGVTTVMFGVTLVCEKPPGHEGNHGNGPFVEYTTEWPALDSSTENNPLD